MLSSSIILLFLSIFILSVFLGVELIVKVPSTLHTPLMSATNAISGITLIGGISFLSQPDLSWTQIVITSASIFFSTINVVGGYLITDNMLLMFEKSEGEHHTP